MPFTIKQPVKLLRIYLTDKMIIEGRNAAEYILYEAKKSELSGASVFHGVAGFGSHMIIHSLSLLHLSDSLPVVVEIIDSEDNIMKFIQNIEDKIEHGLMTIEDVTIAFYKRCVK
jgi:PII-like signaling protein